MDLVKSMRFANSFYLCLSLSLSVCVLVNGVIEFSLVFFPGVSTLLF